MVPNVEYTGNPLDSRSLPSTRGMELDYRTQPFSFYHCRLRSRSWLGATAVGALIFTVLIRLCSFEFVSPVLFGLFSILLTVFALSRLWQRDINRPFLPWAGAAFVFWGVIAFARANQLQFGTALLFYWVALGLAAILADAIGTHHASWMNANPFLDPTSRQLWRNNWNARFVRILPQLRSVIQELAAGKGNTDETKSYGVGFVIVVLSHLIGLTVSLGALTTPLAGLVYVTVSTTILIALAVLWNTHGYKNKWLPLRVYWHAVTNWLTYNSKESPAPGLFQSPLGTCTRRLRLTRVTLFVLSATMIPLAGYFPIVMLATGPQRWNDTLSRPWFEQDSPQPQRRLTDAQVMASMTNAERQWHSRLSPQQRPAYLKTIEARRSLSKTRPIVQSDFSTPEVWLVAVLKGTSKGEIFYLWALLVGVILSVFWPLLTLLAIGFATNGRILTRYYLALENENAYAQTRFPTIWEAYVTRLQQSNHGDSLTGVRERDHIWLGINPNQDYPILLHQDILKEHAWILGDSGAGKTSLGFAPMITQLIRGRTAVQQQAYDGPPPKHVPSILVIDLKGDLSLFEATRIEAERAGMPFKWFTNDHRHSTFAFNPFAQSHIKSLTLNQRAEGLMMALGLEHGESYGRGYYSAVNEHTLRRMLEAYPDIQSFLNLHWMLSIDDFRSPALERSKGERKQNVWKDAAHIVVEIETLAQIRQINLTKADFPGEAEPLAHAIDLAALLDPQQPPQVVYFYLSSARENASVQAVARLALYALLTAADERPPGQNRQVFAFIDEFQRLVAPNLELILEQARNRGIGAILANHNLSDLNRPPDILLQPIVEGSTRFKQFFAASGLDQQNYLRDASGEAMYELHSHGTSVTSGNRTSHNSGWTQFVGPRLRPNDIARITDKKLGSIVQVSRGEGYTRFKGLPFELESQFHIPRDVHEERSSASWPAPRLGTFIPADLKWPAGPSSQSVEANLQQQRGVILDAVSQNAPVFLDEPSEPAAHNDDFEEQLSSYMQSTAVQAKPHRKKTNKRKKNTGDKSHGKP